jgi:sporulation protein YlmC with PRC-barrel domain/osmotically-inducible protein OsmY
MSNQRIKTIVAICAATCVASSAALANQSTSPFESSNYPATSSAASVHGSDARLASEWGKDKNLGHFEDKKLTGSDGQELGKIKDFVIDTQSGKLAFAVVSSDSAVAQAGAGDQVRLVPHSALQFQAAGEEGLKANLDKSSFEALQSVSKEELKGEGLAAIVQQNQESEFLSPTGRDTSWSQQGTSSSATHGSTQWESSSTPGTQSDSSSTQPEYGTQTGSSSQSSTDSSSYATPGSTSGAYSTPSSTETRSNMQHGSGMQSGQTQSSTSSGAYSSPSDAASTSSPSTSGSYSTESSRQPGTYQEEDSEQTGSYSAQGATQYPGSTQSTTSTYSGQSSQQDAYSSQSPSQVAGSTSSATMTSSYSAQSSSDFVLASELKGKQVRSAEEEVGTIEDIAIDVQQGTAKAVISAESSFAGQSGKFHVPFSKLDIEGADNDTVTTTLSREDFSRAQPAGQDDSGTVLMIIEEVALVPTGRAVITTHPATTSSDESSSQWDSSAQSSSAQSGTYSSSAQAGSSVQSDAYSSAQPDSSTSAATSPSATDTASSTWSTPSTSDDEELTPTGRDSRHPLHSLSAAAASIRSALASDPTLSAEDVRVQEAGNKIMLQGKVSSEDAKNRIEAMARAAASGLQVDNKIKVENKRR